MRSTLARALPIRESWVARVSAWIASSSERESTSRMSCSARCRLAMFWSLTARARLSAFRSSTVVATVKNSLSRASLVWRAGRTASE
jgi:hypothetical protein